MAFRGSLPLIALATLVTACAHNPGGTREVALADATEIRGRSVGPHVLYTTSSIRLYSFTLPVRQRIHLYSFSWDGLWAPDLHAELLDETGQRLAYDNNSGPGLNFGFKTTLEPGKYYLKVMLKRDYRPFSRRPRNGGSRGVRTPDYSVVLERYPPSE